MVVAVLLVCFGRCAVGQTGGGTNSFAAYYTGAGPVLTSDSRGFNLPSASTTGALIFQFGFATDEVPGNGQFLDSWTATLQTADGSATAVYFTADASGLKWAPAAPGGVVLDPAGIMRKSISFPSLQPVFANQWAYEVVVPVPSGFSGQKVNLHFDLFDNGDTVRSLGFASTVGVVPEPRIAGLALLGSIAFALRRWRR